MQLSIQAEILSKIVSIVEKATKPKHTLPELATILIEVGKDKTEFTATDMEMQLSASLPIGSSQGGKVAVYAQAFARYIATLDPQDQVELEIKDKYLVVKSRGSQARFNTVDPEKFPKMQVPALKDFVAVDRVVLADALTKTLFATLKGDDTRPVLGGVYFDGSEKTLVLVALDTFRMSVFDTKVDVKDKQSFVAPFKPLSLFEKIIKDAFISGLFGDEDVKIAVSADLTLLELRFGQMVVHTKLIEGSYPDYKAILPSEFNVVGSVETAPFNGALRRIGIFAQQAIGRQVLFTVKEEELVLSAVAQESGEGIESVPGKFEGKDLPLKIGFQYKFLTEFLSVIDADQIEMRFIDPISTAVFLPKGDERFLHIIMPLKL